MKFLAVIHVHDIEQVIFNINVARNLNADGVFLIDHFNSNSFNKIIEKFVNEYQTPEFSVGVNFLGKNNIEALKLSAQLKCRMLWVDNANVDVPGQAEALAFKEAQSKLENPPVLFGGVQFKYQNDRGKSNIMQSIINTENLVDIPTLSGDGTGKAADVLFIKQAHSASLGCSLAIASGVSVDNIELFLPYIDYYLVASSIIDKKSKNELFDENKLNELSSRIHNSIYA
jgi:predicted TIM-barrel enzyme